jgi:aminopeptidase YwaD
MLNKYRILCRNLLLPVVFGLFFIFISPFRPYDNKDRITAEDVIDIIKYLASDELGGRFPGTKGDTLAEEYLINSFKSNNIAPAGEDGYRQKFDFISEIQLADNNSFRMSLGETKSKYTVGTDFYPMSFSSIGKCQGELVFAGYGINAPEQNYNDFAGLNLKGKIAVVMRYSPGEENPHDNPFYKYESTRMKCVAAKEAGASGVILFSGPQSGDDELLTKLRVSTTNDNVDIPVINVKREIVEKIFKQNGKDLNTIQAGIDSLKTPNSFVLNGANAKIQTDLKYIRSYTANIIGYVEGSDPVLKSQVIVIGAHFDHLGDGTKYGSLDESGKPAIHNGADDNASGDAGVLELAKMISVNRADFKRSYLFMLFSGEEAGLLGSAYFTKSELFKKYNIVTMINMDMVGRLRDDKLTVNGVGTSTNWRNMVDSINNLKEKLNLILKDEGYGPSDQSSFYAKDIPVLFFFTGIHKDYHRPSDKWNLINSDGEVKVLDLVYDIIYALDKYPSKPDYIKTKEEEKPMSGFRVTLGIVPDYSSDAVGLGVMGVKPGGPGETAGLQAGDVIIKFGPHDIKNIYDYTYALGDYKPGDQTDIVIKRAGQEMTLHIVFQGK